MSLEPTLLAGTALTEGELLPNVVLTEAESGREWRPGQLRQRSAQLLCFMHADCAACERALSDLAERHEDLSWVGAEVRTVLERPAPSPFPVVLDGDGTARSRILGPTGRIPTLVVADQFTAVADTYPAADHDFPDPDDIITTLRLLACDCE